MPHIIGITGGSGSGKTTFSKKIKAILEKNGKKVYMISSDWFYKTKPTLVVDDNFDAPNAVDLDESFDVYMISSDGFHRTKPTHVVNHKFVAQSAFNFDGYVKTKSASGKDYNFDTPSAFDFGELVDAIKSNRFVMLPEYDYVNHVRIPNRTPFDPSYYDVILIEGIMLYNHVELLNIIGTKIFIHTDLDVCLARRILRDIGERGRNVNSVINQWFQYVKPGYENYIYPTMIHADYIFNNTKESIEENIYNDHKLLKIIEISLSE